MSNRLFPDDVLFAQRLLSCCGLYNGRLDGKWGPITDAADQAFYTRSDQLAAQATKFDARSEINILTLMLEVQQLCRESLKAMRDATGFDIRIISGTRTYADQTAIYRQGRFGNPGPVVSNARAGQSWHNFGRAWDIGIFRSGKYLADGHEYDQVSNAGKVPGVEWGGDWKTFKDKPHYQVTGEFTTLTTVRDDFERGGR